MKEKSYLNTPILMRKLFQLLWQFRQCQVCWRSFLVLTVKGSSGESLFLFDKGEARAELFPLTSSSQWREILLLLQVRPGDLKRGEIPNSISPHFFQKKRKSDSHKRFHLQKWPQLEDHRSERVGLMGQTINHACTKKKNNKKVKYAKNVLTKGYRLFNLGIFFIS